MDDSTKESLTMNPDTDKTNEVLSDSLPKNDSEAVISSTTDISTNVEESPSEDNKPTVSDEKTIRTKEDDDTECHKSDIVSVEDSKDSPKSDVIVSVQADSGSSEINLEQNTSEAAKETVESGEIVESVKNESAEEAKQAVEEKERDDVQISNTESVAPDATKNITQDMDKSFVKVEVAQDQPKTIEQKTEKSSDNTEITEISRKSSVDASKETPTSDAAEEEEEVEDEEYDGPDDDELVDSPAYIPRTGRYYMHDSREENQADNKPIRSRADGKWKHDRFDERWQKPKSVREIVKRYGYDIRYQDTPGQPDSRRGEANAARSGYKVKRSSVTKPRQNFPGNYELDNYSPRGRFPQYRGQYRGTRTVRPTRHPPSHPDRVEPAVSENQLDNQWNQHAKASVSRAQKGKRYSTQRIANTYSGQVNVVGGANAMQTQNYSVESRKMNQTNAPSAMNLKSFQSYRKDDTVYYDPLVQVNNQNTSPPAPRAKKRLEIIPPDQTRR